MKGDDATLKGPTAEPLVITGKGGTPTDKVVAERLVIAAIPEEIVDDVSDVAVIAP